MSCDSYPAHTLRSAGYHASNCVSVGIRPKHSRTDPARSDAHCAVMSQVMEGLAVEGLAAGSKAMLNRPCVDCGLYTGRCCDRCLARYRIPSEE